MNQQEIDRLFHENSHEDESYRDGVMLPHGFAQAAAEIRRQAFLEAGKIVAMQRTALLEEYCHKCPETGEWECSNDLITGGERELMEAINAIRALAQSEQEKSC